MDVIGVVRGKRIELVDVLPYPEGQVVKISIEPLEEQLQPGSPLAIRQMMHQSPHLTEEDMAELEQVITEDRLPVYQGSVFDEGKEQ